MPDAAGHRVRSAMWVVGGLMRKWGRTLEEWKYLHTAECDLALVGIWTSLPAGKGSAKGASMPCSPPCACSHNRQHCCGSHEGVDWGLKAWGRRGAQRLKTSVLTG